MTKLLLLIPYSASYHGCLSQLTSFKLSSDGSVYPAWDIASCALLQTVYTRDVKATAFGSGSSKRVYLSIRDIAFPNIAPAAPVTVFHHKSIGDPIGVPGSLSGLAFLPPGVVVLWVASGGEYRSVLEEGNIGGL